MFQKATEYTGKIERITIANTKPTSLILTIEGAEGDFFVMKGKSDVNPTIGLSKPADEVSITFKNHNPMIGKEENKIITFTNHTLNESLNAENIPLFAKK